MDVHFLTKQFGLKVKGSDQPYCGTVEGWKCVPYPMLMCIKVCLCYNLNHFIVLMSVNIVLT